MTTERDLAQAPQTSGPTNESSVRASDPASPDIAQSPWPLIESFRVGDKFAVQADLPGMQADDIVVEVTETDLIISGERVRSARADGQSHQQERSFGPFRRRVRLPEGVRPETLRATVENGVLSIEFEKGKGGKSEKQSLPQRVQVQRGKPS
jgi:HSP20 family protein